MSSCANVSKMNVQLQLTSTSSFQSLYDFLRVQRFLKNFKPIRFVDCIYKGTNWEVFIRQFAESESCLLHVKSGLEVKDGVESFEFNASMPIASSVSSAFRIGLETGVNAFVTSNAMHQEENARIGHSASSVLTETNEFEAELRRIVRIAKTHDHPLYHEICTSRWECRGNDSTLNFTFFLSRHVGVNACTPSENEEEGADEGELKTEASEPQRRLYRKELGDSDGGRRVVPGKRYRSRTSGSIPFGAEEYWIHAPCGPWGTPDVIMKELRNTLSILGVKANIHTVEMAAERIETKRDVKIRIYSADGYKAFLEKASSLTIAPLGIDRCVGGMKKGFKSEKVDHTDCYYDTPQRHLSLSHITLRCRGIKHVGADTSMYELTLQSSISVQEGQQKRDWACLSIAPSLATKIEETGVLNLDDLGAEGELWKSHLLYAMPSGTMCPLICIARFTTTRYKFPWFASKTQPVHPTAMRAGSQITLTVRPPLLINLDHTVYRHFPKWITPGDYYQNSGSQILAPSPTSSQCPRSSAENGTSMHHGRSSVEDDSDDDSARMSNRSSAVQMYEVEVTNIESPPEWVMDEMKRFLEQIQVEWQLSVNNKLQQYFEYEKAGCFNT